MARGDSRRAIRFRSRLPWRPRIPLSLTHVLSSRLKFGLALLAFLVGAGLGPGASSGRAAEATEARAALGQGDYARAIKLAQETLEKRPRDEEWLRILAEGLHTIGRYPEAQAALTNVMARGPRSLATAWLAQEVFRSNGQVEAANETLAQIPRLISERTWMYRDPSDLIAVGRAMLVLGADPKEILERVFGTAKRAAPELRDIYLASGELALAKHDSALAARHFDEGLKKFPTDADLLAGRARAFADGNREEMGKSIEAALKANPRHIPSLLMLVDHRIDAEDYDGAKKTLDEIHAVNPWHPEAWAYTSVLARLRNETAAETNARSAALRFWTNNPTVPHLIGLKLSQKYRFTDGAARQREALDFDPKFLPAKAQLASDLLRLGEEAEGWELAQQVHETDAYDVAAFNLVTLHDTMVGFTTLTNEHFVVRMSQHEAAVYGPRALALLERARTRLTAKYDATLASPTIVEIFPQQKDFGVRTFGMPDNPGYLGVCFGRVVTANSPAANPGHPVNWEAVLWHEFCHVVTLQLTANKMPRWLSEGISVYEERQANPAWGEQINPKYREMLLDGTSLTPIGKLSAAFLTPKTPLHLQFAYYQSSLVVEFLIRRFGAECLPKILRDLRENVFINEAIEKHTAPLATLEKDFAAFAKDRAEALAPGLDWQKPKPNRRRAADPTEGLLTQLSPTNYWGLKEKAEALLEQKKWAEAKGPLQEVLRHYPGDVGGDSAYPLLAQAHRELGEKPEERDVLERWARRDSDAPAAYLRLMEIASQSGDWTNVVRQGENYLAVNPLVAAPYRHLARAQEGLGQTNQAVSDWENVLRLDPPNPAAVHYDLARLVAASDATKARRHVLQSLQDAPRNRAALRLLRQLGPTTPLPGSPAAGPTPGTNATPAAPATPAAITTDAAPTPASPPTPPSIPKGGPSPE